MELLMTMLGVLGIFGVIIGCGCLINYLEEGEFMGLGLILIFISVIFIGTGFGYEPTTHPLPTSQHTHTIIITGDVFKDIKFNIPCNKDTVVVVVK